MRIGFRIVSVIANSLRSLQESRISFQIDDIISIVKKTTFFFLSLLNFNFRQEVFNQQAGGIVIASPS